MATPTRTAPPGSTTVGTAVPLPAAYAQLNTAADGSIGIKKYIDDSYQKTGQLPNGFHAENGHAVEDEPGFLFRHPWLFPVIGITAGLALPSVVGTAPVSAAGTAASTLGPSTAENLAATSAVVGGSTVPASLATVAGGSVAGLSYADLLKYGLPVAGNLVGNVLQANAAGNASEAQQRYLEEALAYQKEQDTYNRNRQAGLDAQEVQRYGDYQGRIKGFIDNGQNSNDRMSALLGLPPRANVGSSAPGYSSGPPASQRVATDPATQAAIRSELQRTNSSDDPAYWDDVIAAHGDSSTKSWDYWKNRIDTGDGVGKGYAGATSAPAPPVAPTAPAAPGVTTQPQTRAAAVQMRAPDGSVNSVPADQVDHYKSLGATVLGAAA